MKPKYPENEEKLWLGLEENFKDKDTTPTPIKEFRIFGVLVSIWRHFKFNLDFLETHPYKPNGEVPMIFLDIGPIELVFESKCIYKYLYRRKHKYNPKGI